MSQCSRTHLRVLHECFPLRYGCFGLCCERPDYFGHLSAPSTAVSPMDVRGVQRAQEKDGGTSSQPAHFGCDRKNKHFWGCTAVQGKTERDLSLQLSVTTGSFTSSRLPKITQLMLEINLSEEEHAGSLPPLYGRTGGCNGPRESVAQHFNHLPRLEQLSCGNHFGINLSAAFLSEINGA